MASPVIATFLSFTTPQVRAQAVSGKTAPITASTDDDGRKVYVNDSIPAAPRRTQAPTFVSSGLVYWSPTDHRWKPVASANVRAARSAAAEVSQSQQASSFVRGKPFTQQEIDAAHRSGSGTAQRRPQPGAGSDQGGIELQSQRGFPQGGHGIDAADATDCPAAESEQPV